jgi:hypothetical protein
VRVRHRTLSRRRCDNPHFSQAKSSGDPER